MTSTHLCTYDCAGVVIIAVTCIANGGPALDIASYLTSIYKVNKMRTLSHKSQRVFLFYYTYPVKP